MTQFATYVVIGIGGFLGANLRFLVANWAAARLSATFPAGTLVINVTGSFVIGLFLTIVTERVAAPPNLRLFFATGFLGAYTTFSTFTYESLALVQAGAYRAAAINLLTSLVLGMLAVTLGVLLGRTV
jgi:CrcB protein